MHERGITCPSVLISHFQNDDKISLIFELIVTRTIHQDLCRESDAGLIRLHKMPTLEEWRLLGFYAVWIL
jgi:hypothetical protein